MGKIMQKMCPQKLAPDPFLILPNNPKQKLHEGNSFQNKKFWDDYQKPLKKSALFFLLNLVLFNGRKVIKNKRGLKVVTSCSSGYETRSEKSLNSLYIIWPSLMM